MDQGHRARRLGFVIAVVASAWALIGAVGAQASTVSIGSVLPGTFKSVEFGKTETQLNTTLPEKGVNLTSPVAGSVVRWRIQGAEGGPFFLRVLHPTGSGSYTAVGTSTAVTPTDTGLQTFTTNLPIKAGDLIAVDSTNATDKIGVAEVAGANTAAIFPPPFEGATVAPSGQVTGQELELSAEVQPAPAITDVAPASGSIGGGTKVVITGTDFTAASAVKFGETPAASYTVESETKITAITPKSVKPGGVDLTVTTAAGTNPAGSARFRYVACVVPKLGGKTLRAAKVSLRRSGCKLGQVRKVKSARTKVGKVVTQTPKTGKILAPGSKVGLKVGRR